MNDDKPTKEQYESHSGHTRLGRKPGAVNNSTKIGKLAVAYEELDPPPVHKENTPWTEKQAIQEMDFLIRYIGCSDPKKLFFNQCLHERGYKNAMLYNKLAKQFPGLVTELYEFVKQLQRDKVATSCLTKEFDSRFGVFAMQNISSWRQTQTVDVATQVSIKTKDYKGIQETINKRMDDAKKGK